MPEKRDTNGKGWSYGVARYNGDRIEWYRVFSYAYRPRRVLERSAIEVAGRRVPDGEEELALLSDAVILTCRAPGHAPRTRHERRRADRFPRVA